MLNKLKNQFSKFPDKADLYEKHLDYKLQIFTKESIAKNNPDLIPIISLLNSLSFDFKQPSTHSEIEDKLKLTDLLILAIHHKTPVGMATYQILFCGEKKLIYQARGIIPEHQKTGLGKKFVQIAHYLCQPEIISARAQNPISIWTTIKSGILKKTYPIEILYNQSPAMQKVLTDLIMQRGFSIKEVNPNTGLQKKAYKMGQLGNYNIDTKHPGVTMVENKLYEIGLDKNNGDAVYYMGETNTALL